MSQICTVPRLDTWTVSFGEMKNGSVAGLICDVHTTEGEPFAGDPRGNLKRALRHMEEVRIQILQPWSRTRILPL